jgi:hypothetical protein
MSDRRSIPPSPPADPEAIARDTDEQLYRAWAARQDIPLNATNRATFMALLEDQLELGWLN